MVISDEEKVRVETDSLGEMRVPESAYYGASTMRAVLNFPVSGLVFSRSFIRALGLLKKSAALANQELGLLSADRADAIVRAATEVIEGRLDSEFVVDIFQTGSGTSTNMNANEVIANRANELLGQPRGTKAPVHPNDHVNCGQSSNDVIPTVMHIAAAVDITSSLLPAARELVQALSAKGEELFSVIKTGRTHLQDATPIRMGQEFAGFAGSMERATTQCESALPRLYELALGGTAVGTGVNTHPEFASRVIARIAKETGLAFRESDNHFQAQSTLDGYVVASAALRGLALSLNKIACDLRLMGCGPRAGFAEITIPAVQPGSSIMPGKVNPVILESATMVVAQVVGNDATIAMANAGGSILELNVMMPVAAYNLLQSTGLLANVIRLVSEKVIPGITATEAGPASVERALMTCTALAPRIGYDAAAALAKKAFAENSTIRQVALRETSLTEEELKTLLDPEAMTKPGARLGEG